MADWLPTSADYRRLLEFRTELRDFLNWSERAADEAGLTPALHQLLLAVRGAPGATIGDLAARLHVRHHSAVELVQRAEAAGLLERSRDPLDHRRVRVELTPTGRHRLEQLTGRHLPRVAQLAKTLAQVVGAREQARTDV